MRTGECEKRRGAEPKTRESEMPLVTSNIFEARTAVADLELRAQSSQQAAATLQATVDQLSAVQATLSDSVRLQGAFTATQLAVNGTLNAQQATAVSPDITLDNFIAALGLSLALAEATMPDRTINSVSATVQSFLTFSPGPDGVTNVPGLRLYQPELGAPTALATTSFDLAKTVSGTNAQAPQSLYAVLQSAQSVFANAFWAQFTTGNPPTQPAQQIVAEVVKIFAAIGGWSFPYLLQEATNIAGLETTLSGLVASAKPSGAAAAYATSVAALSTLTQTLAARSTHVAGDLFALTSALDASTNLAAAMFS
jgi:hypothetical protein